MKHTLRIASGQGFWGDLRTAPIDQVRKGPIDYLVMDYLAEVTMSILQKQRAKDPSMGYATDLVPLVAELLPDLLSKDIFLITNGGGANPLACRDAIFDLARQKGIRGLKVGVVGGDDILGNVDFLSSAGVAFTNMETGEPLSLVRDRLTSANVYFGAAPIAAALRQGARIVITGRTTDTGLTLAPMLHEFGWSTDDWDKLAAGTVAGHILECGAQASGGNFSGDWRSIPDLAHVGFPIAEARPDATFFITKHAGTGGRVSEATVKEQLLYEIGDPRTYITPDCIADFTSIRLQPDGDDRVRVYGVRGRPATDSYKVSMSYHDGYTAFGTLTYAWPEAIEKARAADRIIRTRLADLRLDVEEVRSELLGVDSCFGPLASASGDADEVVLRIGVRSKDRAAVDRFSREIAPLVLTGPPGVTGFAGGRPRPSDVIAYWPALVPKNLVEPTVVVEEV